MRHPIARAFYTPVTKPRRQFIVSLFPPPETRPLPVTRTSHQLRSQGIALYIARDGQEMLIGLHRERFEAALIQEAGPGGVMMRMPPLRMRDGDPAQDLGEVAIMSRRKQKMPVIGHQTVGGDADSGLGLGFGENFLKGGVVHGLLNEREASHTTVQLVRGEVSNRKAWATWHDGVLSSALWGLSRKCRSLFSPPAACP